MQKTKLAENLLDKDKKIIPNRMLDKVFGFAIFKDG
jgi:hypothetical protein